MGKVSALKLDLAQMEAGLWHRDGALRVSQNNTIFATMRKLCFISAVAAVVLLSSCSGETSRTELMLTQLDGYVSARHMYDARKKDQMAALLRLAQASAGDPARCYEIEMDMAREYFAFSFDSTQVHLKHCQDIALGVLHDMDRYNRASIMLGHLYAKAGSYMEAHTVFYDQIDTSRMGDFLKADYYLALYDFSRDLSGNSGMVERLAIPDRSIYRNRLYQLLPRDTEQWRNLRMNQLVEEGKLQSADSLCRVLLSGTSQEEHKYAIYAFEMSDIAHLRNRPDDRLEWLIKSAQCDIINAVKDYASLTMVAQIILNTDVDRSFGYLQVAQEDALFYNGKLRPWQISSSLLQVENAYQQRQAQYYRSLLWAIIIIGIVSAVLALMMWVYVVRSRKLARTRSELEKSNTQLAMANITLNDLNNRISQADKVKEEYIVSFLEGLAEQISTVRTEDNRFRNLLKQGKQDQLLKELSISGRSEKARDDFYKTFDRTFLAMYPHCVEQFNALLKEDARIVPPSGSLNTELRVFALIRLGVDDSKRIASMLDYSLSTIYNHKVAVKNAALGDRDSFEERVKQIGK